MWITQQWVPTCFRTDSALLTVTVNTVAPSAELLLGQAARPILHSDRLGLPAANSCCHTRSYIGASIVDLPSTTTERWNRRIRCKKRIPSGLRFPDWQGQDSPSSSASCRLPAGRLRGSRHILCLGAPGIRARRPGAARLAPGVSSPAFTPIQKKRGSEGLRFF